MPKTLLHVQLIKDGICSAEIKCETPLEKQRLVASLLSLMDKDEDFANLVANAVALYVLKRKELSRTNEKAIRSADMKIKN